MWVGIIVAFAGGVLSYLAIGHLGRRTPTARPAEPSLDPADLAELEGRWQLVDEDHHRRRAELLCSRLRPLVDRRVPVRVVEPIPALRVVRIRFADGTAVVGRGEVAGDAGVLAALVRTKSVWPGSFRTDADGTHLRFDWSGGRRHMSVLVTGLDQPD